MERMDWSDKKTLTLIEIWGEDNVQVQLEGCKRNKKVFEDISKSIKAPGYEICGAV